MIWKALAAVGAGIAAAIAGLSIAHAEAAMNLYPPAGPCNGDIVFVGFEFPPNESIQLSLARPNTDTELAEMAVVESSEGGGFQRIVRLPPAACELASQGETRLTIFADQAGEPDDLEIYTRATYEITSSALPRTGTAGPAGLNHLDSLFALVSIGISLVLASVGVRRWSGS